MKKRLIVSFVLLLLSAAVAMAQGGAKKRVTGTVTDSKGEPLAGAAVQIQNTNDGTTANMDGVFAISVNPNDKLVVSYVGFLSKTVAVEGRDVVDVSLEEDSEMMQEVVVVGYGEQRRQAVVGAVSFVGGKNFHVPTSNITTSLAGQLPGLISISRTGEPGLDDAEFWIRGISTFKGGTDPLVLVDGVPRDINDLEPDEIDSFAILKDAAATAVYGAEGANGVILVTTKRGSISKPKISFRAEQSMATPLRVPKFVDSWTYMELANEAYTNDGSDALYPTALIDLYRANADPDLYPNSQWADLLMRKHVFSSRYTVNFRGGAENAKYFVSGAYYDTQGVFKDSPYDLFDSNFDYKRYNLRANVDLKVSKTTSISVDLSGQYVDRLHPGRSNNDTFRYMLFTPPHLFPPVYSDGTLATYATVADSNNRNPYNMLYNLGYRLNNEVKMQSKVSISQDLAVITPGLSMKGLVSFDYDGASEIVRHYNPSLYYATGRDIDGNLIFSTSTSGTNDITPPDWESKSFERRIYIEASINYSRIFADKHAVGGMILYNQRDNQLASDAIPFKKQSIVGRATYGYDDRYFIEANFGYSGSENFAKGHRFGFFPSVGIGYYISNEDFYPAGLKRIMNKAKVRLSYGRTGNDDTGTNRFLYRATFKTDGYNFAQGVGSTGSSNSLGAGVRDLLFENLTLGWEIENKRNIGLDLGFMDSDLDITVDAFYNTRHDILLQRNTVQGVAGFNANPWQNYGIVDNWGFDTALSFNHKFGEVRVGARGTFTFARNKIIEYDELVPEDDYQRITGTSIGQNKMYVAERLYTEEDFIRTTNVNGTYSYKLRPGL
ncbi:MAG: TonB-dependent receptor, partial [Bacteroidales bacterium]|nr:TonB-dependent receptor [Bacteroidales bacterium]